MLKKILATAALCLASFACLAAVDANKATEAELDGLKGVGPSMTKRIVDARKERAFKDWPDLMQRVKGLKTKAATKLSAEGLTVNGQSYSGDSQGAGAMSASKAGKPKG